MFILFIIIGIKDHSILFNLKAIHFPDSFPIDIMHLIYENIAGYMFKLWTGDFFQKGSSQDNGDYVFSKNMWKEIGTEMSRHRTTLPISFG